MVKTITKFKKGDYVKAPHMVDARGTIRMVKGKVAYVRGNRASVDLVGRFQGYSVYVLMTKLRKTKDILKRKR